MHDSLQEQYCQTQLVQLFAYNQPTYMVVSVTKVEINTQYCTVYIQCMHTLHLPNTPNALVHTIPFINSLYFCTCSSIVERGKPKAVSKTDPKVTNYQHDVKKIITKRSLAKSLLSMSSSWW